MRHKDIKRECEELWAKNKYFVLSKSHKAYLEIRVLERNRIECFMAKWKNTGNKRYEGE